MLGLSIRWKLAGAFVLLIVLVLSISDYLVMKSLESRYIQDRTTASLANANIIAITGRDTILNEDRNAFYLSRDFSLQMGSRVLLLDQQGRVTVDSFGEDWLEGQTLKHQEVTAALAGNSLSGVHQTASGESVLYVAVPVVRNQETAGAVMLVSGLDDIYQALGDIQGKLLAVSLACGFVGTLVALLLSGMITRPLKTLTHAVKEMEHGQLEQSLKINGSDELGQLAQAFNSMSRSIAIQDRSQRQFLSDASHELRSPLTSIKALAQSLLDGDETDTRVYREFLRDIDSEADRLGNLVHNMLQLTRLEEGAAVAKRENVDIRALIDHLVALMRPQADKREVNIADRCPSGLIWRLDPDLIRSILINLLDNAVRYSPPGSVVTISALSDQGELCLSVTDQGEGVPPEDLPFLFERFYRVDKSRVRSAQSTVGTGLGLAIAKGAASRLGGTIEVQNYPGKGITFTVRIP